MVMVLNHPQLIFITYLILTTKELDSILFVLNFLNLFPILLLIILVTGVKFLITILLIYNKKYNKLKLCQINHLLKSINQFIILKFIKVYAVKMELNKTNKMNLYILYRNNFYNNSNIHYFQLPQIIE